MRPVALLCSGALLLAPLAATGAPPKPAAPLGRWKTQVHDGVVDIEPCGVSICGRLVTSSLLADHPDLADLHDTDPALRRRKLIGLIILQGFAQDGTTWAGGTIYNPADGRIYHARITQPDHDHLNVRGCIFVPLCQTQTWTRLP